MIDPLFVMVNPVIFTQSASIVTTSPLPPPSMVVLVVPFPINVTVLSTIIFS
jgi:hypothetical protein